MSDKEKIENKNVELKESEISTLASMIAWSLHSVYVDLPNGTRAQIVQAIRDWQKINNR